MKPFNDQIPFLNRLDVDWKNSYENSDCPAIDKFLHEILATEDDVKAIYEFIGYCLYRRYPVQKAFMFVGEGSNGKSTVLELIKRFLGSANCSHISLQDMSNRFAVAELHGKLANFYADLKDIALVDTGNFKMLTGGNDSFAAERKFVQRRLNFVNCAKFAFSCNKIPENKNDDTTAFWRRWVIFNFTKVFDEEHSNCDPNILDKLTTKSEFEGLLVKAVEGLHRLLKNNKFSNDRGITYAKTMWTQNDTVKIFCDDMLNIEPMAYVPKTKVYETYLEFCRKRKFHGYEDNSVFGRKLHRYVRCFDVQRKIDDVRGVWCYQGFSLKNNGLRNTSLSEATEARGGDFD
jgi:putative DNA primase/helicase